MMIHSRVGLALVALVMLNGCLGLAEPDFAVCPANTQALDITVTVGQAPVVDWEPACGVSMLFVEPAESGAEDAWQIRSEVAGLADQQEVNRIAPPVTYGVAPSGTVTDTGPDALVTGLSYRVGIYRRLPDGVVCRSSLYDNWCFVGSHTFTR